MENAQVLLGFWFCLLQGRSSRARANNRCVKFFGILFLFVCCKLLTIQVQLIDDARDRQILLQLLSNVPSFQLAFYDK